MNQDNLIIQVKPVIDLSVRTLCLRPYPGHKNGCPNYGKKKGCPPKTPVYTDVYDLSKPVYALINKFNLAHHIQHMKTLHPDWSQRKLECCLYWQPKARKQLLQLIRSFLKENRNYRIETCPEAMGVNVTETLKAAGIILEWPPKQWACQVALAGIERKCRSCGCTWYHGCQGGCFWIKNDLCSCCYK